MVYISLYLFYFTVTLSPYTAIHICMTQHFFSSFLCFHFITGFISLDCGLPLNEPPYIESETGIQFSSDENFIQSGKTGRIPKNLESDNLKQYATVRYFPDGIRNCYDLRVEEGRNYLIRATFFYGNFDGLNVSPGIRYAYRS